MLELEQGFLYKVWHASVKHLVIVIPFQTYSNILLSLPVYSDVVLSLQTLLEVVGVFVSLKFYTKVIYYQGEGDRLPHVSPQSISELNGVIS